MGLYGKGQAGSYSVNVDNYEQNLNGLGCGVLIVIFVIVCGVGGYYIFKKSNKNKKQPNTEQIQKDVKNNINKKNTAIYSNFIKVR